MTLLAEDDLFLDHDSGFDHPESPRRLQAIREGLAASGLSARLQPLKIRPATVSELTLLHDPGYVKELREFCRNGGGNLDADTHVGPKSYDAACLAVGAVFSAIDQVIARPGENAFCAVRPPGHHARRSCPMGFCLFNNVALGAAYALRKHGLSRILIVDWDLHHGNGTEEFFYEDPRVLYVSTHQYPYWPGTGAKSSTGKGAGEGFTLNMPFRAGTPAEELVETFRTKLEPAAERFRPELVLISCGFDAHMDDPLGSLRLRAADYATMTSLVCGIARSHAGGHLVSALEGGYHLAALAESAAAHVGELLKASEDKAGAGR